MMSIESRLKALNITLPDTVPPAFTYVPHVTADKTVFIAGQIPVIDGKPTCCGHLGKDVTLEDAQKAARLCAINILTQIRDAVDGDWDKIKRCVKLGGFVAATPDFTDHSLVINAASDLMVEIFEEAGKHARCAVGVPSLPLGVAVEIDAIFELS